jgi:hypothetical protein
MQGEQNSAAANPQRSISFNQNGVSRLLNNTRIDGSSVNYPWLPTNIVYVPPAEGIETVNVATNSYNAEQGLAGGAEVNVSIKSGTNEFHGAGWIFNTDSHFFAQNFFHPTPQNNLGAPRIQWPPAWNLNRGPASYDHTHNFQAFFSSGKPLWERAQMDAKWCRCAVAWRLDSERHTERGKWCTHLCYTEHGK